jgi:hypothetical protein
MAKSRNVIGLFLGAGASVEVGMPLVWELTEELKGWLTPETLRELNEGWKDPRQRSATSMIGNRQGKTEISHDLAEKCSPSGL